MADRAKLLERAAAAKRASKAVAFHERFDVPELVRDLAALANSGGGAILLGVQRDGALSGAEIPPLGRGVLRSAIERYTGSVFDDVEVATAERSGMPVIALLVGPAHEAPIPYVTDGEAAFYARHGAKSAPATQDDLRRFIDRRVRELRREWLSGIRQVVTAPRGSDDRRDRADGRRGGRGGHPHHDGQERAALPRGRLGCHPSVQAEGAPAGGERAATRRRRDQRVRHAERPPRARDRRSDAARLRAPAAVRVLPVQPAVRRLACRALPARSHVLRRRSSALLRAAAVTLYATRGCGATSVSFSSSSRSPSTSTSSSRRSTNR